MRSELRDAKPSTQCATELPVGTVFVAGGYIRNENDNFLALKVEDIDGCEYIVDMDNDEIYTDANNYYVVRTVNGKFVEEED